MSKEINTTAGKFEDQARAFCDAIRAFNHNEDGLYNLELYLSRHFDKWLQVFANTPDSIANEMQEFATIYDLPF